MALQERLSNAEFLSKLTTLLKSQSTASKGTLYLSQKRLAHDLPKDSSTTTFPLLFRATNGKSTREDRKGKIKISTVVEPEELEAFFGKYAEVCRSGMDGLKKRDRKARKKNKGKGKE